MGRETQSNFVGVRCLQDSEANSLRHADRQTYRVVLSAAFCSKNFN